MEQFDVIVSGAGPGGAATAWRAASRGARVLVCDKAVFPRDKPCGDALTPRAVRWLMEMGLHEELDHRFHRVDSLRGIAEPGVIETPWPQRDGLPGYGYVAARTEFDALLVNRAREVGATVREGTEVLSPIIENGSVRGVIVRQDGIEAEIRAPVTVAADGMSSRLGRMVGMAPRKRAPFAIAMRAQVPSDRPDDATLECYANLRHEGSLLPGYGWIFPMGNGRLNIGIGYMSTYRRWKDVKANQVMTDFVGSLPSTWNIPSVPEMIRQRQVNGWRLPMGLGVWPPWRPGIMAVGDAVGAAKPFTGAGISKALESGIVAADTALQAIEASNGYDLYDYENRLRAHWGGYYRIGRGFAHAIGNPRVMGALVGVGFRARFAADFLVTLVTGDGEDVSTHGKGRIDKVINNMVRAAGATPEREPPWEQRAATPGDRSARIPRTRARPAGDLERARAST